MTSKAVLPICALMDFEPVAFEHGKAVFEGTPAEVHYNPMGTVHGGFAATLLDSLAVPSIPGLNWASAIQRLN